MPCQQAFGRNPAPGVGVKGEPVVTNLAAITELTDIQTTPVEQHGNCPVTVGQPNIRPVLQAKTTYNQVVTL